METQPASRPFQFRLRTLLISVTIAALLFAIGGVAYRYLFRRPVLQAEIRYPGAAVEECNRVVARVLEKALDGEELSAWMIISYEGRVELHVVGEQGAPGDRLSSILQGILDSSRAELPPDINVIPAELVGHDIPLPEITVNNVDRLNVTMDGQRLEDSRLRGLEMSEVVAKVRQATRDAKETHGVTPAAAKAVEEQKVRFENGEVVTLGEILRAEIAQHPNAIIRCWP